MRWLLHGKTKTRLRTDSGWTTLDHGGEMISFYVGDETGAVRVDPSGAKMEVLEIFSETCGPDDALYYAKGPAEAVMYSTHRRRFHEEGIPLGTTRDDGVTRRATGSRRAAPGAHARRRGTRPSAGRASGAARRPCSSACRCRVAGAASPRPARRRRPAAA